MSEMTVAVRERPILFSGPMVRAILDGSKTQTRRVVEPQPLYFHGLRPMWGTSPPPNPVEFGEKYLWREVGADYPDGDEDDRRCPYGVPGDRLWVRETFMPVDLNFRTPAKYEVRERPNGERVAVVYRADVDYACDWSPSIHMPRWASRITLELVDVRVERIQEISGEDAIAEGFNDDHETLRRIGELPAIRDRDAFGLYWDSLNDKRGFGWSTNPWVWALTFRRLTTNIHRGRSDPSDTND